MYKLVQYDSLNIRSDTPVDYVIVLIQDGVKRVLQGSTKTVVAVIPYDGVDEDSEVIAIRCDNTSSRTSRITITKSDYEEEALVEIDVQPEESLLWEAEAGWMITDQEGEVLLNLDMNLNESAPIVEETTEEDEDDDCDEDDEDDEDEDEDEDEIVRLAKDEDTGPNQTGEWQGGIFYDTDDIAVFEGVSYRCLDEHYDVHPTLDDRSEESWEEFDTSLLTGATATEPRIIKGLPGDTGPRGLEGKPGKKGDTGDKGEKGDTGATGEQGLSGFDGLDGVDGVNGADGQTGEKGDKGDTGDIGPQGIPGVAAEPLFVGADGIKWTGAWLKNHDYEINDVTIRNGTSYICTKDHTSDAATEPGTGREWPTVWDIFAKGGANGIPGVGGVGARGSSGAPGVNGSDGSDGADGATGAQGPQGPAGTGSITSIPGFIHGCNIAYTSATTVTIGTGVALDSTDVEAITQDNASLVIDITASGAAGLDTGAKAVSTWYAVHVIWDSNAINTVSAVFSLSATAPTLPAGYTHFRRLGWVRNDSSNSIIRFTQEGQHNLRTHHFTNNAAARTVAVNVVSGGAWTPIDCSALIPTTASSAYFNVQSIGGAVGFLQQFVLFSDDVSGVNWHKWTYNGTLAGAGSTTEMWMLTSATQFLYFLCANLLIRLILSVDGWKDTI